MKKILALVLMMAVSVMAVDFSGVDNGDGTITISYDAPVVGLALDVDSTTVSVTDITLPDFFDVFMDYAYAEGIDYEYPVDENGDPLPHDDNDSVAAQDAAGVAVLPSMAFCISAGGLEDNAGDVAVAGSITLAVTGTGTITITENTLRGGVVDYNGAMTTNLPIVISVVPIVTACIGDVDGSGIINALDVTALVGLMSAEGVGPAKIIASTNPAYTVEADVDASGIINALDVTALVGKMSSEGVGPAKIIVCP